MTPIESIPLLVISCDRYADLWRPFFTIFLRQWPACPFRIHLGTNHLSYDDPRVQTIRVGDDLSWASGVSSMLDALGSEHVILFLEDFLIQQPVDDAAIRRLVEIALQERERVATIRFSPLPVRDQIAMSAVPSHSEVGVVAPRTPYRVSAQPAIWRTDVLRRFLVPGFSPWEFEEVGSKMSQSMPEQFLGPFRASIVYDHGVEKGKWKAAGLRICRELGVDVDLDARGAFSDDELRAHDQSGVRPNEIGSLRTQAVALLADGNRREGWRAAAAYARTGNRLRAAAIAFLGVLGPHAVRLAERRLVERKIRAARQRFDARAAARDRGASA